LDLKEGEYVRHSRFGSGRVTEVGPESVSVHQRTGNTLHVKASDLDKELRAVPSDGFYALLYHKDPDPDFLRDNIEDIVRKMMRDRWSQSISLEEIKRELSPILDRQNKKWESWWKAARKKLLGSGKIQIDPQRKNRFISRSKADFNAGQFLARVANVSDPRELLSLAREVQTCPSHERPQAATQLAQRVLKALNSLSPSSNEIAELLCALCYAIDPLETRQAEGLVAQLATDLGSPSFPPGIEADVVAALGTLGRLSPNKAADLSKNLLSHPSVEVRTKAFAVLNSEAHRHFLKSTLLSWIKSTTAGVPPVELYLRKEFMRHLRQVDINRLYLKVIGNPRLWQGSIVRQFLNSGELARSVFMADDTTNQERTEILASTALSAELKAALVKSLPDADAFLHFVLSHVDPNMEIGRAHV